MSLPVTVGRCRTMSTQPTECRMKSAVKTKARKTNNQASFGGSLLRRWRGTWTKPVCTMFTLCAHAIQFSMIMVYT